MKLFSVKTKLDESGFIFKEAPSIFPRIRAEITGHIRFEFTIPALEKWKKLSEKEQHDLIRTIAIKELTVEDLDVKILETWEELWNRTR